MHLRITIYTRKNKKVSNLLNLYLVLSVIFTVHAQENHITVDTKKEFLKLDADKNKVLEVAEVNQIWKLVRKYDTDNNRELTFEEYSNFEIPYLKTNGDKNLNVKYKSTEEEDLYLDIYYPFKKSETNKYPIVVYTHGGGWFNGSKENIVKPPVADPFKSLVQKGFAIVSVNYRLTRQESVLMRDCVIDAMDALRYLSKNSDFLRLNVNQIYVLGDSAGGQIAQMLLLADPDDFRGDEELYENPYKVIAGVSWYGPSDFTKRELFETDDPTKEADRFSSRITKTESDPSKIEAMYEEMSPIFYLTKNSPPLYMMAADHDTTIPVAHAYHMKEKADEIGAPVSIFVVKNAGHNWRRAGGHIEPTLEVITQKTVDFILKYRM